MKPFKVGDKVIKARRHSRGDYCWFDYHTEAELPIGTIGVIEELCNGEYDCGNVKYPHIGEVHHHFSKELDHANKNIWKGKQR